MDVSRRIYLPPVSIVGPNALNDLQEDLVARNYKKALLISDAMLVKVGVVEKVEDVLKSSNLEYVTFTEVKQNPDTNNVNQGLELLKKNNCDCIITVGGGSPQDCGKAIGIVATNGGNIEDYEGIHLSKNKSLPIIAINTTAGTASEITINYVITDKKRKIKMVMVDKNCLVDIAVNDSTLMLDKPKSLTAATGMDALTHAIEAYITVGAFEWSDTLALKAIEIIASSLRRAVDDGTDLDARTQMAWGQFIAGQAFSNCGLGYVHSMAHQLGGTYDLPHGVCNAILLPYVLEFNSTVCPDKMKKIAEAMGVETFGVSVEEVNKLTVEAIKKLSADVGIPSGLQKLEVKKEDFTKMAENALVDVCAGGNPKPVSLQETVAIYDAAY